MGSKLRGIYANGCMNCDECGRITNVRKVNDDQLSFEQSDLDGKAIVIGVICNRCYEKLYKKKKNIE